MSQHMPVFDDVDPEYGECEHTSGRAYWISSLGVNQRFFSAVCQDGVIQKMLPCAARAVD
jgi:hypothetical protein